MAVKYGDQTQTVIDLLSQRSVLTCRQIADETGVKVNNVASILCQRPCFYKAGTDKNGVTLWALDPARLNEKWRRSSIAPKQKTVKKRQTALVKKRFESPVSSKQKKDCLRALLQHSHIVGEQKDIIRGILSDYTGQP